MTEDDFLRTTRASYDAVAGDYAERFRDELTARPLDRAGVLAWYSTIHIPQRRLPEAFAEFRRVLAPGGYLQLAFQAGEGRYADVIARVREAEDRAVPGQSAMSEAVAEFGYKLMAYKDE